MHVLIALNDSTYSCAMRMVVSSVSLSESESESLCGSGLGVQVAFIGGVADSSGYGWAIAKQLANAGATIIVGTWPPVLTLFERGIKKGFGEDSKLIDGSDMKIDKVTPHPFITSIHHAHTSARAHTITKHTHCVS